WGAALEFAAFVYMSVGNERRAAETFDEAVQLIGGLTQLGWVVVWLHPLAWVAWKLGRADELLEAVREEPLESPWLLAARAIATGDFARAAQIFGDLGATALEMFNRLCAAESFVAD